MQTLLSNEVLDQITGEVVMYQSEIETASTMTYGIDAWFKAYLCSREFQNLSDDQKNECFDAYKGISDLLTLLHQNRNDIPE